MSYHTRMAMINDDDRRYDLIALIEHTLQRMTLEELEALHYDMMTKNLIREDVEGLRG